MSLRAAMTGTRLEFVVKQLPGKVKRMVTTYNKDGGLIQKEIEQPGGYMVYFPMGHCLRLTAKQLKHYKLDRNPRIINMSGLNDPNSPLGKIISAQDDVSRQTAMVDLQKQVMQIATAKTGVTLMPEQVAKAA